MKICDYNHLILYAKGHYKKTNRMDDVRRILEHRSMVDGLCDADVWACAVYAVEKHCPEIMGRVLSGIFKPMPGEGYLFEHFSQTCPIDRALYYVLVGLMTLAVVDKDGNKVLELGEADPQVLPLSETAKKWMEEKKDE